MLAAHRTVGITTQHARNLEHTSIALHHRDVCRCYAAARALADHNVVMRSRGDLRQM